jgi:hypothetical protein
MPADGLTKILVRQKHVEFVKQLSLRDVKEHLPNAGLDSPDPGSLTHRHWEEVKMGLLSYRTSMT